jgi:lambda family phage portal protein
MSTTPDPIYTNIFKAFPSFEGAAFNYKQGLRGLFSGQADTLLAKELLYLQNRSAHVCRNNGYAKSALKNWVTNAQSIKVVWKSKNGKAHKVMQAYWDEFVSNPSVDGFGDMNTFQGISNSSLFITGNSYIRKLIVRDGNTNTIPLKLQLIPSILHDVAFNNAAGAISPNKIVHNGMTFVNSIPTEYHFRKNILETTILENATVARITVPAEEIVHTFIREEPSQWLGVPILSSVLLSLYALDDLITATISKQKAAQSIAILIEQTAAALNMLPVGIVKDSTNPDGSTKVTLKNDAEESQVLYLNKGESAKMFQGTDIGTNFGVLVESELRKIATTSDALYHQLTGDTAGLNYSSLIGMAIQSRNRLEYLHNFLFIPLREKPIADYFKELAVLYNSKVSSAIPYFQLPRWRGIDDLKDTQADVLELQNGLGTYTDKLAERGLSPEDVLSDRETMKELEAFGIFLNTSSGSPNMAQANNNAANSNSTGN